MQKVSAGASRPPRLITYWKLSWPFWHGPGAAAGAGGGGRLMTYAETFLGCRLGTAAGGTWPHFTFKIRRNDLSGTFCAYDHLSRKFPSAWPRPGNLLKTFLCWNLLGILMRKFRQARVTQNIVETFLLWKFQKKVTSGGRGAIWLSY